MKSKEVRLKSDMDYVIYYAERLKKDNLLFEQQRIFLNSQIKSSRSLFSNWRGKEFKKKAREYLKGREII